MTTILIIIAFLGALAYIAHRFHSAGWEAGYQRGYDKANEDRSIAVAAALERDSRNFDMRHMNEEPDAARAARWVDRIERGE